MAKILIVTGIILVAAGIIMLVAGSKFYWFGRLPGDIRIEKENFRLYFPLTTMILLSALFSLVVWIIRKFF